MGKKLKRVRSSAWTILSSVYTQLQLLTYTRSLQGQAGNAVQYMTRTQAMRKLQVKLSVFRYINRLLQRRVGTCQLLS